MISLSLEIASLVNDRGHEMFATALSSANGSRKNRLSDYAICHEQLIRYSTEQALGSIVFKLNEDDDDRALLANADRSPSSAALLAAPGQENNLVSAWRDAGRGACTPLSAGLLHFTRASDGTRVGHVPTGFPKVCISRM
jgi:hypothetical protein